MTGRERIMAAMQGRQSDKVPVLLHNFLLAVREGGMTHCAYRSDPGKLAEAHARAVERYQYDGVMIDVSTAMLAAAVGVDVDYPDDQPARCHKPMLDSLQDVGKLKPVDALSSLEVRTAVEGVRLLRKLLGDTIAIRGNCDQCPFSIASMMRSPQQWMMDLVDGPVELVHQLLEYCTSVTSQFLHLMHDAGADILSNGDSPAGPDMISPSMYREYALPYEKRIAALSHELGKPYIQHICGNTSLILDDLARSGADAVELDYKTDIHRVRAAVLARGVGFVGNIDPSGVLARGSEELVRRKTRELLAVFGHEPRFILNAGCAIPAETPSENLRAMIGEARQFR